MNREQYSRIEAVNFSTLKYMLRSPAHYIAAVNDPEPDDPSRYAVGTLAHALILEGKDISHFYAVKPSGMNFATKEGKEWRKAQTLPIIKEEDVKKTERMAERISRDVDAVALIRGCRNRERCIQCNIDGIDFKMLLDMDGVGQWKEGQEMVKGAILGDLKTLEDCRPHSFAKKVDQLDYDMQLVIYSRGLQSEGHENIYPFWIAEENKAPHEVQVYKPTDDMLRRGREKLDYCIAMLKQYRGKPPSEWPGYGGGIKPLAPAKYLKEIAWGSEDE